MKKLTLITAMTALLVSCTPGEVMIAETIVHEAAVAEHAIEADMEGASHEPSCECAGESYIVPAIHYELPKVVVCAEQSNKDKRLKYWPRGFHAQECNHRQYPKRYRNPNPNCKPKRGQETKKWV